MDPAEIIVRHEQTDRSLVVLHSGEPEESSQAAAPGVVDAVQCAVEFQKGMAVITAPVPWRREYIRMAESEARPQSPGSTPGSTIMSIMGYEGKCGLPALRW